MSKSKVCLVPDSRLLEVLRAYKDLNSMENSGPNMYCESHQLAIMQLAADEGVAQAGSRTHVPVDEVEKVRSTFCAVINHAIGLRLEADAFLRCWNEGDWAGCAEFGFVVDTTGKHHGK